MSRERMLPAAPAGPDPVSQIVVRVNYSETDRMGAAYHGRYAVWLDMARTEHLRRTGISYRELEDAGVLLAVTDLRIRFRRAAAYDDLVRVRCWVRDLASRRVVFGYAIEHHDHGTLLATAETALIATDRRFRVIRLPEEVRTRLVPCADAVPL